MKSYQRNLKKKTNGVKNARPVHVSETLEQIMSVKSPLGLVLYCYLNMPTINKTYLILSYLILNSYIRFLMKLFSDKEIHIFRCFNLIKLKFLFIFTTEIDRQKVLICFTI